MAADLIAQGFRAAALKDGIGSWQAFDMVEEIGALVAIRDFENWQAVGSVGEIGALVSIHDFENWQPASLARKVDCAGQVCGSACGVNA